MKNAPAQIDGLPVKSLALTGTPQQTSVANIAGQVTLVTLADGGDGVPNLINMFSDEGAFNFMHATLEPDADLTQPLPWAYGGLLQHVDEKHIYAFKVDPGHKKDGTPMHASHANGAIRAYHATYK